MKKWTRSFLLFLATAFAFVAVLFLCGALASPKVRTTPETYDAKEVTAVTESRNATFDPKALPTVQRDVDYSKGKGAAWYPKGESPILASLVKEKKLPPVAERVGSEPVVLEGPDGIGKYGGTWLRLANAPGDVGIITWRLSGASLVRWSPLGYPIRPQLAKSWSVSPDKREWTFTLRRGAKWSDGEPFTADDILYWWQEEQLKINSTPVAWMSVGGKRGDIIKIDDFTVKFVFPNSNAALLENLAKSIVGSPKHYLLQ